jgi:hypothetical protein
MRRTQNIWGLLGLILCRSDYKAHGFLLIIYQGKAFYLIFISDFISMRF